MNAARHIVAMEIRKILAYRSDFWVNFLGQVLIKFFIARALWSSIFQSNGVTEMQGMNLATLTLYYLLAPLCSKVIQGQDMGFFSREIYEGGLNRYLVWPVSAIGTKALTYLTHSVFYVMQMLVMYLLATAILAPQNFHLTSFWHLSLGLGFLLISSVCYFWMMMICEMVAFWADNTWALGVMLRFIAGFLGGGFIPLSFFPDQWERVLNMLPFAHLLSTPIRIILGSLSPVDALVPLLVLLGWIGLFMLIAQWVWHKGKLQYTGVGM